MWGRYGEAIQAAVVAVVLCAEGSSRTETRQEPWDLTALAVRGVLSENVAEPPSALPEWNVSSSGIRAKPIHIDAADRRLRFVGRFVAQPDGIMRCSWSGCSIEFVVTSRSVNLLICEHRFNAEEADSVAVYFDDQPFATIVMARDDCRYSLTLPSDDRPHRVGLVKQTEASVGWIDFVGLEVGEASELQPAPSRRAHRLMALGDSITAGYGVAIRDITDKTDHTTSDWRTKSERLMSTYGAIAARTLDFDYVPIAYSGKGVWRNQDTDDKIAFPALFPLALPYAGANSTLRDEPPDAVLVNLGTGDFLPRNGFLSPVDTQAFVTAYLKLLAQIRGEFPQAFVFCTIGPMLRDRWYNNRKLSRARQAIVDAVATRRRLGDSSVYYFALLPQDVEADGLGAEYHPSERTQVKMAKQLVSVLRSFAKW